MSLLNLAPALFQTESLRNFDDKVEQYLRSVEALGGDINHSIFISIITSKLPKAVLMHMEIQRNRDEIWTVADMRKSLQTFIQARESSERHFTQALNDKNGKDGYGFSMHHTNKGGSETRNTAKRFSAEALLPNEQKGTFRLQTPMRCRYCDEPHWSDECAVYATLELRKERMKGNCFICLRPGHSYKECMVTKPCYHCGTIKNHHQSLCPKKLNFRTDSIARTHFQSSINAENTLIASNDMVLMQTALSTIRNPHSQSSTTVRIFWILVVKDLIYAKTNQMKLD